MPEADAPTAPLEPAREAHTAYEATFSRPFLMHGSIGPSAALARWSDGALEITSHTQGPFILRAALARTLGLEPEAIRVRHVVGPGCYGHNGADDVALDAALAARAVPGRPVLLKWTRADEHGFEPYGAPAAVRVAAHLDEDGGLADWSLDAHGLTHGLLVAAQPYGRDNRCMLDSIAASAGRLKGIALVAPAIATLFLYH